jgi:hypothetical protein
MTNDALKQLLEQRVQRDPSSVVTQEVVAVWTAEFGEQWAECEGNVVPSVMYTTFARPPAPPAAGEVAPTGLALHDQLKVLLDLPVAIAVGYELELRGVVHIGDQLVSEERIADLGEERPTKFGPGRDWVIEVATSTLAGSPVGIERFRMLGYRPGEPGTPQPRKAQEPLEFAWEERFSVTTASIRREAAANHVWAPAHHHTAESAGAELLALHVGQALDFLAPPAAHLRAGVATREADDVVLGVKLAHQLQAVAFVHPGRHLA